MTVSQTDISSKIPLYFSNQLSHLLIFLAIFLGPFTACCRSGSKSYLKNTKHNKRESINDGVNNFDM